MSHHYMENTEPTPRRITTSTTKVPSSDILQRVEKARKEARSSTIANLASRLRGVIASVNDQRDPTTYEDVYVAALAFCREYEQGE